MVVLHQSVIRGSIVQLCVEPEDIPTFSLQPVVEEGLLTRIATGVESFAKAHPFLTAFAAYKTYDAVRKYLKSKNDPNLTKMYARNKQERSRMEEVVKEMTKQGWYVYNQKFVAGSGYEWHLKRKY